MSLTVIDFLLFLLITALFLWIFHLKQRVNELELKVASQAPVEKPITPKDLKHLQVSLAELVDEIESFTDEQMQRMRLQADSLYELSRRMERRMQEFEQPPAVENSVDVTRMVPVAPGRHESHSNEKSRIIALHKQGWPSEAIAKELRITKGEVQLIVNLL